MDVTGTPRHTQRVSDGVESEVTNLVPGVHLPGPETAYAGHKDLCRERLRHPGRGTKSHEQ